MIDENGRDLAIAEVEVVVEGEGYLLHHWGFNIKLYALQVLINYRLIDQIR